MNKNPLAKSSRHFLSVVLIGFFFFFFSSPVFAATIVLDPGHSYPSKQGDVGKNTQLHVGDNDGAPGERKAMFETAKIVRDKLKADGYTVIMTKETVDGNGDLDLVKRAEIANTAKADLAVSLHFDGANAFGSWGQVYTQKVGLSRFNGTKANKQNEKKFELGPIADKSKGYATAFLDERAKAEGHRPDNTNANFDTRGKGYSLGNIPMVMLFATVPWIYNEAGGKGFNKEKYALGIYNAIKKAVPSTGTAQTGASTTSCVITKVGNPKGNPPALPAECSGGDGTGSVGDGTGVSGKCGTVVSWGEKIGAVLTDNPSRSGGGFDNLTKTITSDCGRTTPSNEQYGQFWCTFMIIDSYKLSGVPIAKNAGVVAMRKWWKTAKGFKYIDGGSPKGVGPGYAMFLESVAGTHNGNEHVAMVKEVKVDAKGNGTLKTIESNASKVHKTYPVSNWKVKNTSYPVRGFGGK